MIISCTKKLQDELAIKPSLVPCEDGHFGWHGNVIRINRRKVLVLMHDSSRHTVVLYGLKAKDFKQLDTLIPQAIRVALEADGIHPSAISEYLEQAGHIVYSRTQGAKLVARVNKSCRGAELFCPLIQEDQIFQPKLTKRISEFNFMPSETGGLVFPHELFYKALEQRCNIPIIRWPAVTLDVKLDFETLVVTRKLVVPLAYTFLQLHKILQAAFDWDGYHFHDFEIPIGKKQHMTITDEIEEYYDTDPDFLQQESDVKLSEYLPKYKSLTYTYDYGDNWVHLISVGDVIFDYDKNHATCIDGQGTAPPEDTGGESGYLSLLEIQKDKTHPDHLKTCHWLEDSSVEEFHQETLNRQLQQF